jgi:hypothetical protein
VRSLAIRRRREAAGEIPLPGGDGLALLAPERDELAGELARSPSRLGEEASPLALELVGEALGLAELVGPASIALRAQLGDELLLLAPGALELLSFGGGAFGELLVAAPLRRAGRARAPPLRAARPGSRGGAPW